MYSRTLLPVTPTTGNERRDDRGTVRRTALLAATLRVVARDGPAAASHRAVASEADVPLGSTTYYFASRDDMLVEALRHAARSETERIRARVERLTAQPEHAVDWAAEVEAWVLDQLRPARRPLLIARHHLQLEALHRQDLRNVYAAWTAATIELAVTVLRAAGSASPEHDAPLLVAAIDGVGLNHLVLLPARRRPAAVRAFVDHLMARLVDD